MTQQQNKRTCTQHHRRDDKRLTAGNLNEVGHAAAVATHRQIACHSTEQEANRDGNNTSPEPDHHTAQRRKPDILTGKDIRERARSAARQPGRCQRRS